MTPKPLSPDLVRQAKLRLLKMHFEAVVGHIGGNRSALEILLCLYHRVMQAMIGEYVAKIFEEVKQRPLFIRRSVIKDGEIRPAADGAARH
jgi:transketolase N-terminal domain/subunit